MRIAILSPVIGEAFGQERVVRDSTKLLRDAGHEVHLIGERCVGEPPPNDGMALVPGLTGLHWLSSPKKVHTAHGFVAHYLDRISPDIVHFIDQFDYRLMQDLNERFSCVMTSHTVATTCPSSTRLKHPSGGCEEKSGFSCISHHRKQRCLDFLKTDLHRAHAIENFRRRQNVLKTFPRILAISEYVKRSLLNDGFEEDRVRLVYNPVHIPQSIEKLPELPDKLLLCASRLVPHKGIDRLLEALSETKDKSWTLWICGEGPEKERLEHLTYELGLPTRVFFKGVLNYEDLQRLLAASYALVQPNIGPEPFGLSVAEASALGVPVVGFDIPAINEIIEHEVSGLLAPIGDTEKLAFFLDELLEKSDLREQLSTEGVKRVHARFSPEQHLQSTLDCYQSSLAHTPKKTPSGSPLPLAEPLPNA